MKLIRIFGTLLFSAFLSTIPASAKKTVTWDKIVAGFRSSNELGINKVEFADTSTVVHMKFYSRGTYMFPAHTTLVTDAGEVLKIKGVNGTRFSEWMPATTDTLNLQVYFEPATKPAKWVTYTEGSFENSWFVAYIRNGKTEIKLPVPEEWKSISASEDESLPESRFHPGKATVHFYAIGGSSYIRPFVQLVAFTPFTSDNFTSKDVTFDENGKCDITVDLTFPTLAPVVYSGQVNYMVLTPGEDVYCLLDLTKPGCEYVEVKGRLAKTNHELSSKAYKDFYKEFVDIGERGINSVFDCSTPDSIMGCFEEILNNQKKAIAKTGFSANTKKLLTLNAESEYVFGSGDFINTCASYVYSKTGKYDEDEIVSLSERLPIDKWKEYYTKGRYEVMYGPYFTLSENNLLNNHELYGYYTRPDGTNNDYNASVKFAYSAFEDNDFSQGRIDMVKDDEMKKLLIDRKTELDSLEAILKSSDRLHFHELDSVAPDKVLSVILERYKGENVLIDVWETWCGPCRQGHKLMAPWKEEMKGRNVRFVYLSSDSSQKNKWNDMVGEIDGEHYYLTGEQSMAIMKSFGAQGIPTYAIYGADGERVSVHIGSGEISISNVQKKIEELCK